MFTKPLQSPSGVQKKIYTPSAKREFDGVGGVGWVGWGGLTEGQKGSSNLFILCVYIVHVYKLTYTCPIKSQSMKKIEGQF